MKIGVCYDRTFFSVSRQWFMSFDSARSGYVSFKSKIYFLNNAFFKFWNVPITKKLKHIQLVMLSMSISIKAFFFITVGPISVNINATEWMDIEKKFQQVIKGSYRPENCKTRHKVAILVPYRDRDTHLRIFINHMHSFLIRQQLEYGIYIVELVSFLNYFTIRIVFIKRMGEGWSKALIQIISSMICDWLIFWCFTPH